MDKGETVLKKFGDTISRLRKEKGLTQSQLGKLLNVSYQAVSKWENDLAEPSLQSIEEMSKIFDVPVSYFFNESDDEIETSQKKTDIDMKTNIKQNKLWLKLKPFLSIIISGVVALTLGLIALCVPVKYSSTQIYKNLDPAVFCIVAEFPQGEKSGSGFFINNSGLAVTNYHVIENCTSGKVYLNNGLDYDILKVVGCDEKRDIAILQIDIKNNKSVKIGNSDRVSVGETVYAIGYPNSFAFGKNNSTLTEGIISKKSFIYEDNKYIQSTASMTLGNSGGVLVNESGAVIGITTLMITDGFVDYMNMAIPINDLKKVKRNLNHTLEEYVDLHQTFMFNIDNYKREEVEFVAGETIEPIQDPQKTGYIFKGWFTDKDYITPFDFSMPITQDNKQCYAKWEPISYTIQFDGNGANGEMQEISAVYDRYVTLPKNLFEKEHYDFKGWQIYEGGEVYKDQQQVVNLTTTQNDVIVLKASWDIHINNIVFDANGATGTMQDLRVRSGQKFVLPQNQFTKTGYDFSGWLFGDVLYSDGQQITEFNDSDETLNFVAQWTPITYKIIFRFAYGEVITREQILTYDKAEELDLNIFEEEHYHFVYWRDTNGNIYQDGQTVLNLAETSTEVVLNACFEQNTYYVKYNISIPNLTNWEPIIESKKYFDQFKLKQLYEITNDYEGYELTRWEDSQGNELSPDTYYSQLVDENLGTYEVYGIWEICTYELVYYNYNNSVLYKEQHEYFDTVRIRDDLIITNCKGYIHKGFYYYARREKIYLDFGQVVEKMPKPYYEERVSLNPVLEPIKYTISFDANSGQGQMQSIECVYDDETTLPECVFTREKYIFLGWQYNDIFIEDCAVVENLTTINNDNVILTAVWQVQLDGEGTPENSYKISNKQDFLNFIAVANLNDIYNTNTYIEITNDIDLENGEIRPIQNFVSNLDANNHTISNLSIIAESNEDIALFINNSGNIKNLSITNLYIDCGTNLVGGFVANNTGKIENCNVSGEFVLQEEVYTIGGFVADNSGEITKCFSDVTINAELVTKVGGFFGANTGKIHCCYSFSTIDINIADRCVVGGFGGLHTLGEVENCYSINTMNLNSLQPMNLSYIGGFIGNGGINFSNQVISNCFVKTIMEVNIPVHYINYLSPITIGDFCGTLHFTNISNNIYKSDQSSFNVVVNEQQELVKEFATTVADENLKNEDWVTQNVLMTVGIYECNGDYPVFKKDVSTIEINTKEEFMKLNKKDIYVDVNLNCDIDLQGEEFYMLKNFATFNGNGHTISNLSVKNAEKNKFGLFLKNEKTIKNLHLLNVSLETETSEDIVIGVVTCENNGTISNISLDFDLNVFTSTTCFIGGISGINSGTIKNCFADVNILATMYKNCYIGAISGQNLSNSSVYNCITQGDINVEKLGEGRSIYCKIAGIGTSEVINCYDCISFVNISVDGLASYYVNPIAETYTNCYPYIQQRIVINSYNREIKDGKTKQELCSDEFLSSLHFGQFQSQEYLEQNEDCVWIYNQTERPSLWFEV